MNWGIHAIYIHIYIYDRNGCDIHVRVSMLKQLRMDVIYVKTFEDVCVRMHVIHVTMCDMG